jgi:hypothetical protein
MNWTRFTFDVDIATLNPKDWKFNLFGIVLTDQTFSIENQCCARLKEKSI